jgi:hypothetical protein
MRGSLLPNGEYAPSPYSYSKPDFSQLNIRKIVAIEASVSYRPHGLKTCPICGHHDCFKFIPKTQAFICFSDKCGASGDIISFIMHLKKCRYRVACDYIIKHYCNRK